MFTIPEMHFGIYLDKGNYSLINQMIIHITDLTVGYNKSIESIMCLLSPLCHNLRLELRYKHY